MKLATKQVDRLLRKLGTETSESAHHVRSFVHVDGRRVWPPILFDKHQSSIPRNVYRRLLTTLRLSEAEFLRLVNCRISADQYYDLRREQPQEQVRTDEVPCLVDQFGEPLGLDDRVGLTIVGKVTDLRDRLLENVRRDPKTLFEIESRQFELLIERMLQRQGFETMATPASRDGGRDILAVLNNEVGSFLLLVECKRYAQDNPVGVELVRQLHGVVQQERATAGVLITTSYFTEPAREFQRSIRYQLSLVDYEGLLEWLATTMK